MNIGYLQTSPVFGRIQENFDQVEHLLAQHQDAEQIDLLVLPELFSTGYAFTSRQEAASLADPADGRTAEFLRSIAARTKGVVVAGFAEQDGERLYNSSIIVDADRVVGHYRKVHLFNKESLFFSPGDAEPPVFTIGELKLGVMICFDWIFPEVMRILMLKGAEVVAHPANLVLPYCQEAMKTRCLENRLFAVTANRTGREQRGEDDFTFTGASQVTAYNGKVLSTAPVDKTAMEIVNIDPSLTVSKLINPYNDLYEDRRVELYGALVNSGNRK